VSASTIDSSISKKQLFAGILCTFENHSIVDNTHHSQYTHLAVTLISSKGLENCIGNL
jgi:hypothetical protein